MYMYMYILYMCIEAKLETKRSLKLIALVGSNPRQLIFLRTSDCLGCAVLLCLVCLFDLACFYLPSFSSHKHVLIHTSTALHILAEIFRPSHLSLKHVHVRTWKYMCIAH